MEYEEIQKFAAFWGSYGRDLVIALVILVVGIFAIQRGVPLIDRLCVRMGFNTHVTSGIATGFYILLSVMLLSFVLSNLGLSGPVVRRFLMAIGLFAAAAILLLRPYIPKLPFRPGHLIKTGSILGKVEDISVLNTRLKSFDGLIIMVPNAKILNDYVINYHSTPNRRIKVDVAIRYDQDIVSAKRVIEELMIQDPRILPTPRPSVNVVQLDDSWVQIGGRGWVKNPKAWVTRCEILEKIKYRFEHEGIQIAFPRSDIHIYQETPPFEPDPANQEEVVTRMLAHEELVERDQS